MKKTKSQYLEEILHLIRNQINHKDSVPTHYLVEAMRLCKEALNK